MRRNYLRCGMAKLSRVKNSHHSRLFLSRTIDWLRVWSSIRDLLYAIFEFASACSRTYVPRIYCIDEYWLNSRVWFCLSLINAHIYSQRYFASIEININKYIHIYLFHWKRRRLVKYSLSAVNNMNLIESEMWASWDGKMVSVEFQHLTSENIVHEYS